MKFRHFLNVLQNSWNLQNSLESPLETCMWNLRQFGEVTIFDGKCQQRRTFKTVWNLDIFSMFSKIHETYRIYWNHHQKHACEIWGSSEKLQFLMENADSAGPSKQDEILTFSQCSPKFMKLTEFIGITTRNMHVKFEAVRRSYNFWHKNAYSAGPLKQDEIYTFSQWFSKIHETYRSYWNHHQKHACEIWGGSEKLQFLWKNAYSAGPSKQDEIWDFLNVLQNSWHLQNLLESPPETCMWILRQFGEATFFDGKCRQRWTFKTGWNFDIFSMFSKIHETYRSYWNDHQKHACEIWGSSEKLQFLT